MHATIPNHGGLNIHFMGELSRTQFLELTRLDRNYAHGLYIQ